MSMLTSNYPKLDYDFASLFIGNEKQLLIYRKCWAVDNYITKYRLPNTIKAPLSRLEHLTDEFHFLKV
jgi:hypothetical protein